VKDSSDPHLGHASQSYIKYIEFDFVQETEQTNVINKISRVEIVLTNLRTAFLALGARVVPWIRANGVHPCNHFRGSVSDLGEKFRLHLEIGVFSKGNLRSLIESKLAIPNFCARNGINLGKFVMVIILQIIR